MFPVKRADIGLQHSHARRVHRLQRELHAMAYDPIKPSLASFAEGSNSTPPRHLGRRYDDNGRFLPEPGNTVVCHLVPGSATESALVEIRRRMQAMPQADHLAFTPVSSLHMTLFQGIIEYRRALPYWPADMALDTPIETMTDHYRTRLAGFRGGRPFRVRTIDIVPTGLVVAGATAEDAATLAAWRDELAERFGYRHPDHETYEFHITLAYMRKWLPQTCLPAWNALFSDGLALLAREAPILELRVPAFCSFEDMNHFEELLVFEPGDIDSAA